MKVGLLELAVCLEKQQQGLTVITSSDGRPAFLMERHGEHQGLKSVQSHLQFLMLF